MNQKKSKRKSKIAKKSNDTKANVNMSNICKGQSQKSSRSPSKSSQSPLRRFSKSPQKIAKYPSQKVSISPSETRKSSSKTSKSPSQKVTSSPSKISESPSRKVTSSPSKISENPSQKDTQNPPRGSERKSRKDSISSPRILERSSREGSKSTPGKLSTRLSRKTKKSSSPIKENSRSRSGSSSSLQRGKSLSSQKSLAKVDILQTKASTTSISGKGKESDGKKCIKISVPNKDSISSPFQKENSGNTLGRKSSLKSFRRESYINSKLQNRDFLPSASFLSHTAIPELTTPPTGINSSVKQPMVIPKSGNAQVIEILPCKPCECTEQTKNMLPQFSSQVNPPPCVTLTRPPLPLCHTPTSFETPVQYGINSRDCEQNVNNINQQVNPNQNFLSCGLVYRNPNQLIPGTNYPNQQITDNSYPNQQITDASQQNIQQCNLIRGSAHQRSIEEPRQSCPNHTACQISPQNIKNSSLYSSKVFTAITVTEQPPSGFNVYSPYPASKKKSKEKLVDAATDMSRESRKSKRDSETDSRKKHRKSHKKKKCEKKSRDHKNSKRKSRHRRSGSVRAMSDVFSETSSGTLSMETTSVPSSAFPSTTVSSSGVSLAPQLRLKPIPPNSMWKSPPMPIPPPWGTPTYFPAPAVHPPIPWHHNNQPQMYATQFKPQRSSDWNSPQMQGNQEPVFNPPEVIWMLSPHSLHDPRNFVQAKNPLTPRIYVCPSLKSQSYSQTFGGYQPFQQYGSASTGRLNYSPERNIQERYLIDLYRAASCPQMSTAPDRARTCKPRVTFAPMMTEFISHLNSPSKVSSWPCVSNMDEYKMYDSQEIPCSQEITNEQYDSNIPKNGESVSLGSDLNALHESEISHTNIDPEYDIEYHNRRSNFVNATFDKERSESLNNGQNMEYDNGSRINDYYWYNNRGIYQNFPGLYSWETPNVAYSMPSDGYNSRSLPQTFPQRHERSNSPFLAVNNTYIQPGRCTYQIPDMRKPSIKRAPMEHPTALGSTQGQFTNPYADRGINRRQGGAQQNQNIPHHAGELPIRSHQTSTLPRPMVTNDTAKMTGRRQVGESPVPQIFKQQNMLPWAINRNLQVMTALGVPKRKSETRQSKPIQEDYVSENLRTNRLKSSASPQTSNNMNETDANGAFSKNLPPNTQRISNKNYLDSRKETKRYLGPKYIFPSSNSLNSRITSQLSHKPDTLCVKSISTGAQCSSDALPQQGTVKTTAALPQFCDPENCAHQSSERFQNLHASSRSQSIYSQEVSQIDNFSALTNENKYKMIDNISMEPKYTDASTMPHFSSDSLEGTRRKLVYGDTIRNVQVSNRVRNLQSSKSIYPSNAGSSAFSHLYTQKCPWYPPQQYKNGQLNVGDSVKRLGTHYNSKNECVNIQYCATAQMQEHLNEPEIQERFNGPQMQERFNGPQIQERLSGPQMRERLNRPQMKERLNEPQMQERFNGPQMQERLNGPQIQERLSGSQIQERLSGPQMQERLNRPQMQERLNRPQMQERLNEPQMQESLNRSQMQERLNRPQMQKRLNGPQIQKRLNRPEMQERLTGPHMQERLNGREIQLSGTREFIPNPNNAMKSVKRSQFSRAQLKSSKMPRPHASHETISQRDTSAHFKYNPCYGKGCQHAAYGPFLPRTQALEVCHQAVSREYPSDTQNYYLAFARETDRVPNDKNNSFIPPYITSNNKTKHFSNVEYPEVFHELIDGNVPHQPKNCPILPHSYYGAYRSNRLGDSREFYIPELLQMSHLNCQLEIPGENAALLKNRAPVDLNALDQKIPHYSLESARVRHVSVGSHQPISIDKSTGEMYASSTYDSSTQDCPLVSQQMHSFTDSSSPMTNEIKRHITQGSPQFSKIPDDAVTEASAVETINHGPVLIDTTRIPYTFCAIGIPQIPEEPYSFSATFPHKNENVVKETSSVASELQIKRGITAKGSPRPRPFAQHTLPTNYNQILSEILQPPYELHSNTKSDSTNNDLVYAYTDNIARETNNSLEPLGDVQYPSTSQMTELLFADGRSCSQDDVDNIQEEDIDYQHDDKHDDISPKFQNDVHVSSHTNAPHSPPNGTQREDTFCDFSLKKQPNRYQSMEDTLNSLLQPVVNIEDSLPHGEGCEWPLYDIHSVSSELSWDQLVTPSKTTRLYTKSSQLLAEKGAQTPEQSSVLFEENRCFSESSQTEYIPVPFSSWGSEGLRPLCVTNKMKFTPGERTELPTHHQYLVMRGHSADNPEWESGVKWHTTSEGMIGEFPGAPNEQSFEDSRIISAQHYNREVIGDDSRPHTCNIKSPSLEDWVQKCKYGKKFSKKPGNILIPENNHASIVSSDVPRPLLSFCSNYRSAKLKCSENNSTNKDNACSTDSKNPAPPCNICQHYQGPCSSGSKKTMSNLPYPWSQNDLPDSPHAPVCNESPQFKSFNYSCSSQTEPVSETLKFYTTLPTEPLQIEPLSDELRPALEVQEEFPRPVGAPRITREFVHRSATEITQGSTLEGTQCQLPDRLSRGSIRSRSLSRPRPGLKRSPLPRKVCSENILRN